jgi:hypothetical protein
MAIWVASAWMQVAATVPRVSITIEQGRVFCGIEHELIWKHRLGRSGLRDMWDFQCGMRPHITQKWAQRFGLCAPHWWGKGSMFEFAFVIPFWLLALIAGASTGILWLLLGRFVRPGCCVGCGYDLRGSASNRCSECGREMTRQA